MCVYVRVCGAVCVYVCVCVCVCVWTVIKKRRGRVKKRRCSAARDRYLSFFLSSFSPSSLHILRLQCDNVQLIHKCFPVHCADTRERQR